MISTIRGERILVVSPHADDELLGAGGTLMRAIDAGATVKMVLVACSDIVMESAGGVVSGETRRMEFERSAMELSTEPPSIFGLLDSRLDTYPIAEIVSMLDREIRSFRPTVALIPSRSYHQDHRVVSDASVAALRPTRSYSVPVVMMYEVPTGTWGPSIRRDVHVDVSMYIDRKIELYKNVYMSQSSSGGSRGKLSPEWVYGHAVARGAEVGVMCAECFEVMRVLV